MVGMKRSESLPGGLLGLGIKGEYTTYVWPYIHQPNPTHRAGQSLYYRRNRFLASI